MQVSAVVRLGLGAFFVYRSAANRHLKSEMWGTQYPAHGPMKKARRRNAEPLFVYFLNYSGLSETHLP
jgi:hypothetical protein